MHRKRTWEDVTRGVEARLEAALGMPTAEQKAAGLPVRPSNRVNPFNTESTRFEFDGGARARIRARGSNSIGRPGFRGQYHVEALTAGGATIPNLSPRRYEIGGHVVSLRWTYRYLRAPFTSKFGYHWTIDLWPVETSSNQSYLFFEVFREPVYY